MATFRMIDGYRLEVPPYWDEMTPQELARVCNGVGPDDWPAWRRRVIGELAPFLVPGSRPHDVRWSRPMTDRQRHVADRELWRNWRRTIRQRLRWKAWHWLVPLRRERYLVDLGVARLAYDALRLAGAKYATRIRSWGSSGPRTWKS
jgi:hypothetical protein